MDKLDFEAGTHKVTSAPTKNINNNISILDPSNTIDSNVDVPAPSNTIESGIYDNEH
jgi:hypothetical protein